MILGRVQRRLHPFNNLKFKLPTGSPTHQSKASNPQAGRPKPTNSTNHEPYSTRLFAGTCLHFSAEGSTFNNALVASCLDLVCHDSDQPFRFHTLQGGLYTKRQGFGACRNLGRRIRVAIPRDQYALPHKRCGSRLR